MLKILYNFISSPKIFVYTVLWLMILVFFGTLAQKDIGLYASQMKYFSSYIFLFYDSTTWEWDIIIKQKNI